jgi:hypothetical protein
MNARKSEWTNKLDLFIIIFAFILCLHSSGGLVCGLFSFMFHLAINHFDIFIMARLRIFMWGRVRCEFVRLRMIFYHSSQQVIFISSMIERKFNFKGSSKLIEIGRKRSTSKQEKVNKN